MAVVEPIPGTLNPKPSSGLEPETPSLPCSSRPWSGAGSPPEVGAMPSWYLDTIMADMASRKSMTLRLTAEQADELEAVARAEGISVSDAVREAIGEHIERKRKDKAFRERLRAVMERDREILERLGR
jgi:hypothetical protein